ncbi:MAG: glycosyltransferase [Deltaproteobacteria bacterium]|nr:glycosyltransferase [Deltaproteobacteria bacterium]
MDPLGQSQVLPYVRGLSERGHQFELLSFEKPGTPLCFRKNLAPNIRWTTLRYHRSPSVLATMFDMWLGLKVGSLLCLMGRVNRIHVRSYVPCAMMLLWAKISRTPLLFDTRGLWADEKVDSGSWSSGGWLYRLIKKLERQLFKHADAITVLTHSLKNYLLKEYAYRNEIKAPISVISTCTDLKRFSLPPFGKRGRGGILIYVGSLGGCYMTQEMLKFYAAWRRVAAKPRFLLVTKSPIHEFREALISMGAEQELIHRSVDNSEVPDLIRSAQAGICLIRPSFSKRGSAPTKLGELLACGVPVVANIVGDMARVLEGSLAGIVLSDFSDDSLERAAKKLFECSKNQGVCQEARVLAEKHFDLEKAIDAYHEIYQRRKLTTREAAD